MTFHIASALKSAAVTAGTVLWIGTAAAAPLPLFQTGSAASSLTRDQTPPDETVSPVCRVICDARRSTIRRKPPRAASSSISRKPSSTTSSATALRSVTASVSAVKGSPGAALRP